MSTDEDVGVGGAGTVDEVPVSLPEDGGGGEREGFVRQTSMEEESAQALLALNKGLAAGTGVEAEGEVLKKKKRKGKKKRKDKQKGALSEGQRDGQQQDGEGGHRQEGDEMPDSQRIISQHLAAHMSKIAPTVSVTAGSTAAVSATAVDDVLMLDAAGLPFATAPLPPSVVSADHILTSTPARVPSTKSKGKGKAVYERKRKRVIDSVPNEDNTLVDPALMEWDEATAAAAAAAAVESSDSVGMALPAIVGHEERRQKRKRRLPTAKIEEGAAAAGEKRRKGWKKKVGVVVNETDVEATPVVDAPDAAVDVSGAGGGEGDGDGDGDGGNSNIGGGEAPTAMGLIPPSAGAGGPFTLEEKQIIDNHLERYARQHALTHDDLCARVWANERRKDDFWEGVCLVLPMRSRASIYKHVRRQYHVFNQRAKWTESEDDLLEVLVKEKGNAWKSVGEAMGRMGEDCRDRWRNYGKCGKDRGKDRWEEDEEAYLKKTLTEVLTAIRARRGITEPFDLDAATIDYEGEDEVNWTVISDLMQNKRSRIQCRYKWNKMKQLKARAGGLALPNRVSAWEKKKTKVPIDDMLAGDHIWLLSQIRDSGARAEKRIPWDDIAAIEGTWSPKELEKAYKKLRSTVPHKRTPVQEVVAKLMTGFENLSEEDKSQRYPFSAGSVNPASPAHPSHSPPATHLSEQHSDRTEFEYPDPPSVVQNVAPVASMGIVDVVYSPTHVGEDMDLVDPELIGQGIEHGVQQDLEKTAGEAIMIAAAAAARERERSGEDETERELRRRLGEAV